MEHSQCVWKSDQLYDVVGHLCQQAGIETIRFPPVSRVASDLDSASSLMVVAHHVGIDCHHSSVAVEDVDTRLSMHLPAVVHVEGGGSTKLLGAISADAAGVALIGHSGRRYRLSWPVARHLVATLLTLPSAESTPHAPTNVYDPFVRSLGQDVSRGPSPAQRLVVSRLATEPALPLWRQLVSSGLHKTAGLLGALFGLRTLLVTVSWWILGAHILAGTLDEAGFSAWILVIGTLVAVGGATEWLQGHLLLAINARYRQKILHGATHVPLQLSRRVGSGQLLGQIFETAALDTLAVQTGLTSATALMDIAVASSLFLFIPGASVLAVLFAGWLAVVVILGLRIYALQRTWTEDRIAMSQSIVETIIGRRTRLAQGDAVALRDDEDRSLRRYLELSADLDRAEARFAALAGRGWLLVALSGLALAMAPGPMNAGPLAATIGAILLGYQALSRFAGSIGLVTAFAIAWQQARTIYASSGRPEHGGIPELVESGRRSAAVSGRGRLRLTNVTHARGPSRKPVLDSVSVEVAAHERILLTGASGAGKTTLATLMAGIETPTSGGILLDGFDVKALGHREWSRRIAYVPSFEANYVFSNTFLYNLLPGRWPPTQQQVERAEQICEEMRLGDLLRRMPGHLNQIVGETGWRLSHGEQARLFLARAILQDADVIILDECFGALDPGTMKDCIDCVLQQAPALVVISHV